MIVKAIGLKLADLREDPTGGPGSRILQLLPKHCDGVVEINLTVAEVRLLRAALPQE